MKITIVEREIQEAIRAHIHSLIALQPGTEITMDFSATRGPDGLIANIDIRPAGSSTAANTVQAAPVAVAPIVPAPEPEPAPAPVKRVTRAALVKEPVNVPAAEPEAQPEAAPEAVQEAPAEEVEEPPFETDEEEAPVVEQAAPEPVEEEPPAAPAKSRSIFAKPAAAPVEEEKEEVAGDQPLKPSIFSNLARVSNSAPEAEAA